MNEFIYTTIYTNIDLFNMICASVPLLLIYYVS